MKSCPKLPSWGEAGGRRREEEKKKQEKNARGTEQFTHPPVLRDPPDMTENELSGCPEMPTPEMLAAEMRSPPIPPLRI